MYLCEDADDNEGYVPRSPLWIKETHMCIIFCIDQDLVWKDYDGSVFRNRDIEAQEPWVHSLIYSLVQ